MSDTLVFDATTVLSEFDVERALKKVGMQVMRGACRGLLIGSLLWLMLYAIIGMTTG